MVNGLKELGECPMEPGLGSKKLSELLTIGLDRPSVFQVWKMTSIASHVASDQPISWEVYRWLQVTLVKPGLLGIKLVPRLQERSEWSEELTNWL